MKISYIREMKRSYLTIETEDEEQREKGAWEAGMLEQNRIRGLLPMRVRYEEGRKITVTISHPASAGADIGNSYNDEGAGQKFVLAALPGFGGDGKISFRERRDSPKAGIDLCGTRAF